MRILGIEFGTWSLKATEMESRFRRLEVLEFHEVKLPLQILNPTEAYASAIQQLMARLPTHPDKMVTSLPANQTALRFLQFPIKKQKKVEQMYRFDLEDAVPFRLEDCILNHHFYPMPDGSLVFVALSPKKNIQSFLSWLKEVGLEVDWFAFEGMGLINVFLTTRALEDEEERNEGATLLLDIGHSKTNLAVLRGDRLEFFRTLTWGGSAINHSIAINLGLSLEDADALKQTKLNVGGDAEEENELRLSGIQALSPFLVDLNHSMVSYRNLFKQEIQSIRITGGTSKLQGLGSFLEKGLSIPVTPFTPFSTLSIKNELKASADEFRFTESWGRAMVFARKAPLLFNFRQGDLAKYTSLNEVSAILQNPHIIKLGQYLCALFAILFVHVTIVSYFADKELVTANDELKKVFQDTFRTVSPKTRTSLLANTNDLKKFIDQKNSELEQKLAMLSKAKASRLSLLSAISGSFPKTLKVDVNDLQIDDSQLLIDGVIYEGDLAATTELLKKIPHVMDLTLQKEGQRFTYRGKVASK